MSDTSVKTEEESPFKEVVDLETSVVQEPDGETDVDPLAIEEKDGKELSEDIEVTPVNLEKAAKCDDNAKEETVSDSLNEGSNIIKMEPEIEIVKDYSDETSKEATPSIKEDKEIPLEVETPDPNPSDDLIATPEPTPESLVEPSPPPTKSKPQTPEQKDLEPPIEMEAENIPGPSKEAQSTPGPSKLEEVLKENVQVAEKEMKEVQVADSLKVPSPVTEVDEKIKSDAEMADMSEKTEREEKEIVEEKVEVVKESKHLQPVNGEASKEEQTTKRRASDDILTESPLKRLCQEVERTFPQHDSTINDYINAATKNSVDEIQRHTEQLLSEIQTLRELAQKKEQEWNNILHLKKVKEEILLRLLRKKQVLSFEKSPDINGSEKTDPFDFLNQPKNLAIDKSDEISGLSIKQPGCNVNPMMQAPVMPITSHYNSIIGLPPPYDKAGHMHSIPKPVFPQAMMMPGHMPGFPRDMNGQLPNSFGMPMGRQGPTKDVKSIIADYRQRNPDITPRRGRRMKSILNPMMNTPRPIAPKMDPMGNLNNLNMLFGNLDANQKAMLERLQQIQAGNLPNGLSFKDVLVQFANMQQSSGLIPNSPMMGRPDMMNRPDMSRPEMSSRPDMSNRPDLSSRPDMSSRSDMSSRPEMSGRPDVSGRQEVSGRSEHRAERRRQERVHEEVHIPKQTERVASSSPRLPPPPPYPEISLLPVTTSQETTTVQQNSLLHGILTKQSSPASQSYSPTLAKLLTSPERKQSAPTLPTFGQAKNCGEITITPVQPTPPPPEAPAEKPEEVVQLDESESPQSSGEGCGSPGGGGDGRLVIDEAEGEAPLCQGCRRRDAQFVCAGCANQWYCSRECQVAAWDDHSDMCSG